MIRPARRPGRSRWSGSCAVWHCDSIPQRPQRVEHGTAQFARASSCCRNPRAHGIATTFPSRSDEAAQDHARAQAIATLRRAL
eukprot:5864023-Prymnesium_polylepis.3